jgi:hypothetical protein
LSVAGCMAAQIQHEVRASLQPPTAASHLPSFPPPAFPTARSYRLPFPPSNHTALPTRPSPHWCVERRSSSWTARRPGSSSLPS